MTGIHRRALKGRHQRVQDFFRPFRAGPIYLGTQGVALGWLMSGLWPCEVHDKLYTIVSEYLPRLSKICGASSGPEVTIFSRL